jgi:hypothetical protein
MPPIDTIPSSTAPNEHYRKRHLLDPPKIDSEAFRPHFRRISPADLLLRSQAINFYQWQRAGQFRDLYEHAHQRELQSIVWDKVRVDYPQPDKSVPTEKQLSALESLARIGEKLGGKVFAILVAVVIDEIPWAALAKKLRVCPRTARTKAAAAIAALAAT